MNLTKKIILFSIIVLLTSCANYKIDKSAQKKEKKYYSSNGFALIYNDDTTGDKAVCVLNFGGDKTASAGTFTIQFPDFTAAAAILRLANA